MKKIWLLAIPAVVVLTIITVVLIQQNNRPKQVVEAFEQAVDQKKPEQLKDILLVDNKKAEIDESSLKAFVTYLNANYNSYQVIKDSLEAQLEKQEYSMTNQQISLVEDGKRFGVFTDYKLKVKTGYIKVTGLSEEDQVTLSVDKTKDSLMKSEEELYGPLLPGTYDVRLTVKNTLGTFLEKRKVEVWGGSKQVSLLVDDSDLAQKDKGVQQNVLAALDVFNNDLIVFQTNNYETKHFTNVTDEVREVTAFAKYDFEFYKEYVDEIQMQYLGAVVNLDDLDINRFNDEWLAEVTALVSYKNKMKVRDMKGFEDISYKTIRTYKMKYDEKSKKWLIADLEGVKADGSESDDWENKTELKNENSPVMKWNRKKDESNMF
ncbi:TcaA second domain-containing protein [Peribacillus asahii]|uniref:TcaA second domain-containing protein n=1 Tax=Peribacillus asahii TaxID=228899 RepID=UPI00207A9681|nr:hypothetical protein [Peribacillus asahii]USK71843.1 hypothetical protein LIS76_08845 [Peribacillus asahii]